MLRPVYRNQNAIKDFDSDCYWWENGAKAVLTQAGFQTAQIDFPSRIQQDTVSVHMAPTNWISFTKCKCFPVIPFRGRGNLLLILRLFEYVPVMLKIRPIWACGVAYQFLTRQCRPDASSYPYEIVRKCTIEPVSRFKVVKSLTTGLILFNEHRRSGKVIRWICLRGAEQRFAS